jgi:hypothetical protein
MTSHMRNNRHFERSRPTLFLSLRSYGASACAAKNLSSI